MYHTNDPNPTKTTKMVVQMKAASFTSFIFTSPNVSKNHFYLELIPIMTSIGLGLMEISSVALYRLTFPPITGTP